MAVLVATGGVAQAQSQAADPVFARVLIRRLDSIATLPEVKREMGARNGLELMRKAPIGEIARLDDAKLMRFVDVFNAALGQAPTATCAAVWRTLGTPQYGANYAAVAASADSLTSEAWTDLIVELVWAGVRGQGKGRRADSDEVRAVTERAHTLIPPDELRELMRIQAAAAPSDDDQCYFLRASFRSMLRLPPEVVAPIFRSMVGG